MIGLAPRTAPDPLRTLAFMDGNDRFGLVVGVEEVRS